MSGRTVLTVVGSATWVASTFAQQSEPVHVAPEAQRESVAPPTESKFHPSLLLGVRALAHEQIRLADLCTRIERGEVDVEKKLYADLLEALPDDVRHDVDSPLPDLETVAEMFLAWRGHEVFQQIVDDAAKHNRPLRVDDLLEVAWSDRLRELPTEREEPEVVAFARRIEKLTGKPVPLRLWWSNVGYLFFGALHTPAFWPSDAAERDKARAEAIQDLLSVATTAIDADAARSVVDVALQPPLRGECRRKAVTSARGSLAALRGRVGFTREHLDFVSRLNREFDAQRRADPAAAATDASRSRLAEFMATMKLRILLEVDPASADSSSQLAMKYGTVEESLAYYRQLLQTLGVQPFWSEAKHDVERILSGRFPHPLDGRIAAIDERLADRAISEDERDRLKDERAKLVEERERDQRRVASFAVSQFGWLAPLDQAVAELHRMDALATPEQQQETLNGWIVLAQRDPVWARRLVAAHLDTDDHYSEPAIVAAATALALHADDAESAKAFVEIATRGSACERGSALAMAKLLPKELAQGLFDTTVADVEELLKRNPAVRACQPSGDDATYSSLLRGAVDVLYQRRGESWVADALGATFDHAGVNLWKGGSPFSATLGWGNREILDWIADTIDDESWKKLADGGRIPDALARVRKERRAK